MPSPFPGMDPYLEGELWPTVHGNLTSEIVRQLTPQLRPRYLALMEKTYGLEWPDDEERIARMDEGLTLIDSLWRSDEPLSFDGRYFETHEAVCRPKPAQRPRPPVWLGESRSQHWNDTIVRHADGWNSTPASPTRLAEKLAGISDACRRVGRDLSTLELSLEIQILIAPTEDEVRATALQIADLPPSNTRRWVIRRKAEVVAAVRGGLLSLEEACQRYKLTTEEFLSWQSSIDEYGLAGLRTTRIQQYRH